MGLKDTDVCKEEGCYFPYYAKELCRKHYRQMMGRLGGYKKEYIQKKSTDSYKAMKQESDKRYRQRLINEGRLTKIQHKYYLNWISKKTNHNKKLQWAKRDNDNRNYNGQREEVIKRDGYKCTNCGLTREYHYEKYGFDLNIHHLDGNGWGKPKDLKNNNIDNLITLCHLCHHNLESSKDRTPLDKLIA